MTTTKQLNISSFPLDCIVEILEHLYNDSITPNSLYSCLLTNRQWAKLAVPLIWRSPFGYKIKTVRCAYIIETLVSCLKDDEKQRWTDLGFKISKDRPRPLFDYPTFIRSVCTHSIQLSVTNWLRIFQNIDSPCKKDKLVTAIDLISHLIFGSSRGLEFFRCDHDFNMKYNKTQFTILPNLELYNGINVALSNLKIFETQCWDGFDQDSGNLLMSYINSISRYSQNIKHIKIYVYLRLPNYIPLCQSFAKLIEAQKSLYSIELCEWWDHSKANLIYTALQSQAHSLKSFHTNNLRHIRKLFPMLSACVNLEDLCITNYYEIEDVSSLLKNFSSLSSIHIKHLEASYQSHFEAKQTQFSALIQLLIRLSNQNLKSLKTNYMDSKILENVSRFCPKISHLTLHVTKEDFPNLYTNLPNMTSLEHLILVFMTSTREGLSLLAQKLPTNLKHLGVRTSPSFSVFFMLKNLKVPIEVLDIYNKIDGELMKYIIEFAERIGKLMKLGIVNKKIVYQIEESERANAVIDIIGKPNYREFCSFASLVNEEY
ncbi:6407_t:CDS:1 [Diversispora eburnea]|uniref:6407_t:CDS:1 n=1 Tax=Diversispora eburnea TaxID=1213867 RepID=A0A9N9AX96_9GLOM|nr:6407_t:CDS:1 [Diversispora eburnea]